MRYYSPLFNYTAAVRSVFCLIHGRKPANELCQSDDDYVRHLHSGDDRRGFAAWRYTRDLSDYILGGRSLGSFLTAMRAGAWTQSGWLLLGLPGAVYASGVSESWIAIGLIIGAWFNWQFVAGPHVYTEITRNAFNVPDYFTIV